MMIWDIAGIVFVCVTANHLGLIRALRMDDVPVIGCVKCCTFWSALAYMVINEHGIIATLAVSFLASYAAIWAELAEGFIDLIYMRLYEKIITTDSDDTPASDTGGGDPDGSVPEL